MGLRSSTVLFFLILLFSQNSLTLRVIMRWFWSKMSPSASWKFAPLGKPYVPSPNIRKLEGVVFDVDGTLW